ncbi:alpha/beta fold hydrolase [Rhodococcus sp. NPDC058521]|uniref:alpha/beta fold hydrolase n=1 Tax=Rhodococcus sp. NPDC058521 TaxID=3346536 RepID=UPI00365526E7
MVSGVHVVVGGAGPPVVICSGLAGHWFDWDDTAEILARGHTVIRYDRPGYGSSPAATAPPEVRTEVARIVAILDALAITQTAILVGHSLGAVYAEAFARLHPARTRSSTLLDPAFSVRPRRLIPTRWRVTSARTVSHLISAYGVQRLLGPLTRRLLDHSVPPGGFTEQARRRTAEFDRQPHYLEATLVENAVFPSLALELAGIRTRAPLTVPVTVAAADTGRPTPWGVLWLRRMHSFSRILGARYVVVRPAHHQAMIDRPAEVAKVISESDH